ncbi:hypothetical protein MMC25_000745 [Agyrium rufum]|nr:hypothetical protein [Agyrium rufum]
MALENHAAWLPSARARFTVSSAPMPTPSPNRAIIRVHAAAINPADYGMQATGMLIRTYPMILGCDIAGEVVSLGSSDDATTSDSSSKFKPGDRVTAGTDMIATGNAENGGFQLYVAAHTITMAKIPDGLTYAEACVLPLGISTAAAGLFQKDQLGLDFPPSEPKLDENGKKKVIFIWGGSSSVGSSAIQLARAAGYDVATTAGAANLEYCKTLGAMWVFDYKLNSVVEDVFDVLKANGRELAGAFSAVMQPADALIKSATIVRKMGGRKFLSTVVPPVLPTPLGFPEDVTIGKLVASTIRQNEVGPAIWGKYIPAALADGSLKCKPEPFVVGQGLEKVQEAVDMMGKGVSAKKLVVVFE